MRILTRYLIRAHVGPFLFALTVLTGLLFLNTVARNFEELAGKGLPLSVLGEFLVLSLPHILALTLPMSVLVAVLYTFSELTANNEYSAMVANGINPIRILLPVLGVGALLAGGMALFNDRVLPDTNHRLKNLMIDISRASPTLELREQVMNEIRTGARRSRYFLQATGIDQKTNRLTDVAIYDLSEMGRARTIYADHGTMAFNRDKTDLFLTLYDGVLAQGDMSRPSGFQRLYFQKYILPLRGVGDALERRAESEYRSDRELNVAMLDERARATDEELAAVRREAVAWSVEAARIALGLPPAEPAEGQAGGTGTAREPAPSAGGGPSTLRRKARGADRDPIAADVAARMRTLAAQEVMLYRRANSYRVEIHKKFAIAFACLVFVLIGGPLAVRSPRGGVGMVIALSLGIFAIYWVGLIGGENLADKGIVDPFWAMWTPNFLLVAVGLAALGLMGREGTTPRGGSWRELAAVLRRLAGRTAGRLRAADAEAPS